MSVPDHHPDFLTEQDEFSLRESRDRQTADSQPDTLEVRGDEMTVMRDSLRTLRAPIRAAAVAVGVAVALVVVGGLVNRARRGGGITTE